MLLPLFYYFSFETVNVGINRDNRAAQNAMIKNPAQVWPNTTIPYTIHPSLSKFEPNTSNILCSTQYKIACTCKNVNISISYITLIRKMASFLYTCTLGYTVYEIVYVTAPYGRDPREGFSLTLI